MMAYMKDSVTGKRLKQQDDGRGVKKYPVIPQSWCDQLLTGPNRVIGDPPYNWPDIERLLLAIQQRYDAAVQEVLKSERARVRRLVRKERRERTKTLAIYRASSDPRDYMLAERVEGGMTACDDILNALKEDACTTKKR